MKTLIETNEIVSKILDAIDQLAAYNEMLRCRMDYMQTHYTTKDFKALDKIYDATKDMDRAIDFAKQASIDIMIYSDKPF